MAHDTDGSQFGKEKKHAFAFFFVVRIPSPRPPPRIKDGLCWQSANGCKLRRGFREGFSRAGIARPDLPAPDVAGAGILGAGANAAEIGKGGDGLGR